ncbi:MAG: ankyrin repeat domain-containing protein [Bacteroidales bacterium]|nr:ankyrin repeat domain-containing protein [Bacteroidales bacterium]
MSHKITFILIFIILTITATAQESDQRLIDATKRGNYSLLNELLATGINPDTYDSEGFTALMYASDLGNDSICRLLLDFGANPNLDARYNNAVPAITNCVIKNDPRLLDLMLQYHANPNLVDSVNHYSLLHYAVTYGYIECADVLLFHGANPNLTSNISDNHYLGVYPRNPLQMAVSFGDTLMAQLLIDKGANVNAKPDDITPLALAISKNDYKTADFLLRYGADANLPSQKGAPLVYSVIYSDNKMSQLLINHGAKIDATDSHGNNLATLAMQYGKNDSRKFFESQGVKNSKLFIPSAVTFSFAQEFCRHEYRMSFRLGFHESHLNTMVYAGISFRPSYKPAFVKRGEKSYWQLREKRTMLQLGLEKRISFVKQHRPDFGAYVGYQFAYCSGRYDGAINKKPESCTMHSPSIGIYQRFSGIGFSSGYRYYGYPDAISAPIHTVEINMTVYFNFFRQKN